MFITVTALISRILSNPAANALQKLLSTKYSSISINVYSYFFLSLFCLGWIICASLGLPNLSNSDIAISGWSGLSYAYWSYVALAGILCTLGSVCLIKALQLGEMSVLGPINSYKCLVGLFFGWIILGEIPHIAEIFGVILIIFGSWYIFDTEDGGFNFKLLLRKDIILRFCALFFTGCEAVVLKKIILMSSVEKSFILWCFSGFIFSLLLMCIFRPKFKAAEIFINKNYFYGNKKTPHPYPCLDQLALNGSAGKAHRLDRSPSARLVAPHPGKEHGCQCKHWQIYTKWYKYYVILSESEVSHNFLGLIY